MSASGNKGDNSGERGRGEYRPPNNADESESSASTPDLTTMISQMQQEMQQLRVENQQMRTAAAAVLGQEGILDDIVRLHQAAQLVSSPTHTRGEIIPSIQVTRSPSTVPTYQDAFELWISAMRGTLSVDRASIFLDFNAGIQGSFLPWIHGALCKLSETLRSRIEASPVWSMDLLVQMITVLQLLVSVRHASQTASQWKPSLEEIFNTLSTSIAALPNSLILPTVQKRVQRFLNIGERPSSWIDITPSSAQMDSTNSLLDQGTFLIFDSVADTLVLVTGEPQIVYLLGHSDVDSLDMHVFDITLKLRSPLPVLSLRLSDQNSRHASVFMWTRHAWFDEHIVWT